MLADDEPDAPPQAMRIAAASWTGIDEADVADVADAVIAEPANAAAIVPPSPRRSPNEPHAGPGAPEVSRARPDP